MSRSHTTTDHNNKANNTMDCHPHVKWKVMRKTGSASKNLLTQIIPKRDSVDSVRCKRVRQWLKLDYVNDLLSVQFLNLISVHTQTHTHSQHLMTVTRSARNWWILYHIFVVVHSFVATPMESTFKMIFCLICSFIQMNRNRAVFSPFFAYPS